MKVLVTGGAGFIGSHLADRLMAQRIETVLVDNLSGAAGDRYAHPSAVLYAADVRDEVMDGVFARERPDAVVHLAAQIDVSASQRDPLFDADVNIMGTLNVLRLCASFGVRRFVYASSAAVYGAPQYLSIDEQHPLEPQSCYGVSKGVPEMYIRLFAERHGFAYTIFRFANVYGPRQCSHGEAGVVSIFLDRMLQGESPLINGDGLQTRDFVYVGDVADAVAAAVLRDRKEERETFNIGCGVPTAVLELVQLIGELTGSSAPPLFGPGRPGDIRHSYLNNGKARDYLQWMPTHDLRRGLAKTIEFRSREGR
ncbi:NAD-dependent epimerase/dehydratase family protein [Paenibacillus koleovorans]|uniref:NAD-dependent epimerase/dehydratase family protein n=1 Tax=Paenibacillus koleovorans TaxID=121608 RepID=UPI000FD88835|nr:NAD-dependent epimerase/dehydratase family protein [Paenibacillus koleovorans]